MFVTLSLLLWGVHHVHSTCTTCPSGFTVQGDECYLLDTNQWLCWKDAKAYCEGKGGYLAKLDTSTKRSSAETYIKANINKYILDTRACDSYGQLWIGGTDATSQGTTEGNWKWTNDATSVSGGWYGDEPDQKDRCGGCYIRSVGLFFGRKKRQEEEEDQQLWDDNGKRITVRRHWGWRPVTIKGEGPDCMSFYRRPSIGSKAGDFLQMDECCGDKKFPLCEAACTVANKKCTVGTTSYNSGDTIATGSCYIQKCEDGSVTNTETCPSGFEKLTVSGKTKCYLYGTTQSNWATAKTFCEGKGGHLAVITSADEQSAVRTWLKGKSLKKAWLGGYAEVSGTGLKPFEWQSGNLKGLDITTIYTDWCGTQPENVAAEQCLGIDDPTKTNGVTGTEICWSNRKCQQNRNPVCEICDCDTV